MILCCGEALIDMLPAESAGPGGHSYHPHCGGAAFNTAIALGRLGEDSALVSGLSTDLFGEQLRQELAASGASAALAVTSARPTTLAFVTLTEGHARYAFWDQGSAMRGIAPRDLPAVPPETCALLFGGISLCNLPMAESFHHLARDQNCAHLLMLDLNIRPGFAEDEAVYHQRLGQMVALCDIVKLSQEDLELFVPGPGSEAEKLQRVCAVAPGLVILTRGAGGALAVLPQGVQVEVAAQEVAVVDTVGAGDSFNAGFLSALRRAGNLSRAGLQRLDATALRAALVFATRVATHSVTRAGANPPWRQEL